MEKKHTLSQWEFNMEDENFNIREFTVKVFGSKYTVTLVGDPNAEVSPDKSGALGWMGKEHKEIRIASWNTSPQVQFQILFETLMAAGVHEIGNSCGEPISKTQAASICSGILSQNKELFINLLQDDLSKGDWVV